MLLSILDGLHSGAVSPALVALGTKSYGSPQQSMIWTSVVQKLGRLQGMGFACHQGSGKVLCLGCCSLAALEQRCRLVLDTCSP